LEAPARETGLAEARMAVLPWGPEAVPTLSTAARRTPMPMSHPKEGICR
jgi:hypothetical protein